jgi:ribosomal protein S18 acetylase RimI-like enzyme
MSVQSDPVKPDPLKPDPSNALAGTSTQEQVPLQFRFASIDDAADIADLVESGYRGERSRSGWTTEADLLDGQRTSVDAVLDVLADPHGRILLGELDIEGVRRLVASAHIERHPAHAYFGMFSVRPGLQNSGIGRQMLAEAERIALEDWAVAEMRMSVIDLRTELVAWYERRGYQRTGVYLPFPYGDERFGLPKRFDLRFEILKKSLLE